MSDNALAVIAAAPRLRRAGLAVPQRSEEVDMPRGGSICAWPTDWATARIPGTMW